MHRIISLVLLLVLLTILTLSAVLASRVSQDHVRKSTEGFSTTAMYPRVSDALDASTVKFFYSSGAKRYVDSVIVVPARNNDAIRDLMVGCHAAKDLASVGLDSVKCASAYSLTNISRSADYDKWKKTSLFNYMCNFQDVQTDASTVQHDTSIRVRNGLYFLNRFCLKLTLDAAPRHIGRGAFSIKLHNNDAAKFVALARPAFLHTFGGVLYRLEAPGNKRHLDYASDALVVDAVLRPIHLPGVSQKSAQPFNRSGGIKDGAKWVTSAVQVYYLVYEKDHDVFKSHIDALTTVHAVNPSVPTIVTDGLETNVLVQTGSDAVQVHVNGKVEGYYSMPDVKNATVVLCRTKDLLVIFVTGGSKKTYLKHVRLSSDFQIAHPLSLMEPDKSRSLEYLRTTAKNSSGNGIVEIASIPSLADVGLALGAFN